MRPFLEHILRCLTPVFGCAKNELEETLLVASNIGGIKDRQDVLNIATSLLRDETPAYLRAGLAYQQSILYRLKADYKKSQSIIRNFLVSDQGSNQSEHVTKQSRVSTWDLSSDKRLHALCGLLLVSSAENLVQTQKHQAALARVNEWTITNKPCLLQLRVVTKQSIVLAKIFQAQGRFQAVQDTLEHCLVSVLPSDPKRCQILCSLADAHLQLGSAYRAFKLLANVSGSQVHGRALRRLLVSSIDVDIGRREYGRAEGAIQQLTVLSKGLSYFDVVDQLLHIRMLISSILIDYCTSSFPQALERCKTVLSYLNDYISFKKEGFTYAVIQLFKCLLQLQSSSIDEARKSFDQAAAVLSQEVWDYWIPTLPSWCNFLRMRIEAEKGWVFKQSNTFIYKSVDNK